MQKLNEIKSEMRNFAVRTPVDEHGPADHEATFRAEVLQELVELRNEMRNLKENNTRLLQQIDTPSIPGNEPLPA
jgi:hypothetical protein